VLSPDGLLSWELEHAAVTKTSVMQHLQPDLLRADLIPDHPPACFPTYDVHPFDPASVSHSRALTSAAGARGGGNARARARNPDRGGLRHARAPVTEERMLTETDRRLLRIAYDEAKAGCDEGGCPVGSVPARGDTVVAQVHNQRVQRGDPIAHGEMDALRKAGRQRTYRDMTVHASLSPCMMCAGTIVQFGIPRVVNGENRTSGGNEEFLRSRGVEVIVADDPEARR
jgi:cytosine deaminase